MGMRERVTLDVRALDLDHPADVALGRAPVEEYVEFTADEAREHGVYEIDRATLRRVIPDLHDLAGRYRGGAYLVGSRDGTVVAPYRTGAIALYESMGFRPAAPPHEYPFDMLAYARVLRQVGR